MQQAASVILLTVFFAFELIFVTKNGGSGCECRCYIKQLQFGLFKSPQAQSLTLSVEN